MIAWNSICYTVLDVLRSVVRKRFREDIAEA